ncbi:MAG: drug/metabolite transporter (DMT)-like permease [Parasphingorhabdus sp.]|jgi:drug/metabolite transporter (DMT)-like permease
MANPALSSNGAQVRRDSWVGILLVVSGLSMAAMVGAIMKLLASDMSAIQVAWLRFAGYAALMLPLVWVRFGRQAFVPRKLSMQVFRGFAMALSTTLFVIGVRTVDFADAIAILYAYPFLLTLLAIVFLGERVSLLSWVAVSGGFIGVLLVMRPGFADWNVGAIFIFLCAIIVSLQMALNRRLGFISNPLITSFWGATVATIALTFLLPGQWQPIDLSHAWPLIFMILLGAISQTLVVFAFSRADASVLAPFTYFEIVAAILIGVIIFGTLPTWLSWIGIMLIGLSGLMVARVLPR